VQVDLHSTPALRRGSGRRVPEGFLRRVGWRGFDERGWGGGSAGFGKFGAGAWRADVNGQARGNGVSTPHSPITMQGRRERGRGLRGKAWISSCISFSSFPIGRQIAQASNGQLCELILRESFCYSQLEGFKLYI